MYLFIYSFQNDLAILGEIFPVKPENSPGYTSIFYTVAQTLNVFQHYEATCLYVRLFYLLT